MMEVIPETHRALIIRYLRFYFYMSNHFTWLYESKLSHASTAKSNQNMCVNNNVRTETLVSRSVTSLLSYWYILSFFNRSCSQMFI